MNGRALLQDGFNQEPSFHTSRLAPPHHLKVSLVGIRIVLITRELPIEGLGSCRGIRFRLTIRLGWWWQ